MTGIDLNNERGPWMTTRSGRRFYAFDPRPEDVSLEDISHHLSMQCRYNGATSRFYSVAEHSVLCSELARILYDDPVLEMATLIHDAAEAYVGDLVKPVKVRMPGYSEVEDAIMSLAICPHFGVQWPLDERVHEIDMILCATEKRDLLPGSEEWPNMPEPFPDWNLSYGAGPDLGKAAFEEQCKRITSRMSA